MNGTKKSQPPNEHSGDPTDQLIQVHLFPIQLDAWLFGKTLRPFLAELFDLSPSLLRRGRKLNLRKKKEEAAIASANQWSQKMAAKNGWDDGEITAYLSARV